MTLSLPSVYPFREVEEKWRSRWEKARVFESRPDERPPYTIVIPPPNVTGILHIGHILNNTLQDVLIRRARMQGYNACWVPGTDHASIATEAKVVAWLREKGIDKKALSREAFLQYAWEWTHKHGGIILRQLRQMGASCDWARTTFTMDPHYYDSVIHTFVRLYEDGLIYRGHRMINWDPQAQTALSDEEVIHKEVDGRLYYIRYPLADGSGALTIATTRPETMLGDTAVAVHPEDERYRHLVGKEVRLPLADRLIPIIADEYVDPEFGTGALKVTPAHDPNDFELGAKHHLDTINIFTDDARIVEEIPRYAGLDRFEARRRVVEDLKAAGLLEKIEPIRHSVGFSERTDAVVEPRLSEQWFVKMKPLAEPALRAVLEGNVKIMPDHFAKVYRHWMENILDWCISRQLWWGHRIPAYYLDDGRYVVAHNLEEAVEKARHLTGNPQLTEKDLRQDEDVLDTWFSSWLWPLAVFNGVLEPDNPDFQYYYPTQTLVTGHEIIFLWVARMVMAGYYYTDQRPFENVYIHGIVRDKQGRKMSKSLGNSPDVLRIIDEEGADALRLGVLFSAPAGNDLLFSEELVEQGRHFANKIWNALRLVAGWKDRQGMPEASQQAVEHIAGAWFSHRMNRLLETVADLYQRFRINEVLRTLYSVIWNEFFSVYLEAVKPAPGASLSPEAYTRTVRFFEDLMKLLHPFMPFITEEVYHRLGDRPEDAFLALAREPQQEPYDPAVLEAMDHALAVISQMRYLMKTHGIAPGKAAFKVRTAQPEFYTRYRPFIEKLAGGKIELTDMPVMGDMVLVGKDELYLPLSPEALQQRLEALEKELAYQQGFLRQVEKKLSNPRFVERAPAAVVEREQQKKASAVQRIASLSDQIKRLKGA